MRMTDNGATNRRLSFDAFEQALQPAGRSVNGDLGSLRAALGRQ
jgi:hypothetical protein